MHAKFNILLVDDDPNVLDIIERASKHVFPSAAFSWVKSVQEASTYLDKITGKEPEIILLDIHLLIEPNGLEFLTLLRNHALGKLIPVIVLTAASNKELTNQAYERGANAFTIKPDTYSGWKSYVEELRLFWFDTVKRPAAYGELT
jgi:CheY-like chemotaxis protein